MSLLGLSEAKPAKAALGFYCAGGRPEIAARVSCVDGRTTLSKGSDPWLQLSIALGSVILWCFSHQAVSGETLILQRDSFPVVVLAVLVVVVILFQMSWVSGHNRCLPLRSWLPPRCGIQCVRGLRIEFLQVAAWQPGSVHALSFRLDHLWHCICVCLFMRCWGHRVHRVHFGLWKRKRKLWGRWRKF